MPPSLKNVSIKLEDDGVAIINYNRPKNANALGDGMMEDLLAAFTWALDDHKVKVVVHSGEGRFFSAGMVRSFETTLGRPGATNISS